MTKSKSKNKHSKKSHTDATNRRKRGILYKDGCGGLVQSKIYKSTPIAQYIKVNSTHYRRHKHVSNLHEEQEPQQEE